MTSHANMVLTYTRMQMTQVIFVVEECVDGIMAWMKKNMLKLTDEKTEDLAIITPNFTDRLQETHLEVGDASVRAGRSARNFGAIFHNTLTLCV